MVPVPVRGEARPISGRQMRPVPQEIIQGVRVKALVVQADARGRLVEILRRDEELFEQFGQVYMTTAYPGVVKGWHYHKQQVDHFCCVRGMIKLALYDDRDGSSTRGHVNEFFLGPYAPKVVRVPSLVWHGFMCVSEEEAIVINVPTEPYDHTSPDEYRHPPHVGLTRDGRTAAEAPGEEVGHIPYDWTRRDG